MISSTLLFNGGLITVLEIRLQMLSLKLSLTTLTYSHLISQICSTPSLDNYIQIGGIVLKRYSELIRLPSFEDRFEYCALHGKVGLDTFGFDRYINQAFYNSKEWKALRNHIISRDNGCDLGIPGREINGTIYIHHLNPITPEDFEYEDENGILDPDNLICVSYNTHQAIHYGDLKLAKRYDVVERSQGDTCPWK